MSVEVEVLAEGDGATYPQRGQTAIMHYVGTLTDGAKFDSSRDRGQPFRFQVGVGQVIKGWDESVPKMSVGQKSRLTVAPEYGYGAQGFPGAIPPNATLIFEVELLGVE